MRAKIEKKLIDIKEIAMAIDRGSMILIKSNPKYESSEQINNKNINHSARGS